MKSTAATLAVLAVWAPAAHAGGIDRSGQGLGNLFEPGRQLELAFGSVSPSVSGNDAAIFGGGSSGDVAATFSQLAVSYKYDINETLSFAMIFDQPFGADVLYGSGSVALGNTKAVAETEAITGLLRYKFDGGFSVHGGVRAQRAGGDIDLRGAAYRNPATPTVPGSGFDGYSVALGRDTALGYVVGVAYERPEIALRIAMTYNSAVEHTFDTVETVGFGALVVGTSPTISTTPQSVNLDFQTGVAKNTLVFGQIRWADWSEFRIDPAFFTQRAGEGLIDLEDSITYTIGVGRRFSETWAGSFSIQYEDDGDPLVSPLAPTNGRFGATLAAVHTMDNMKITAGINYTKLGDAQPETGTPDVARANFSDNTSVGVGLRVAFTF